MAYLTTLPTYLEPTSPPTYPPLPLPTTPPTPLPTTSTNPLPMPLPIFLLTYSFWIFKYQTNKVNFHHIIKAINLAINSKGFNNFNHQRIHQKNPYKIHYQAQMWFHKHWKQQQKHLYQQLKLHCHQNLHLLQL